uniref:Reverse transcriptase Ty1/copia-type domain-containing protein n=1 Tax=Solanum lycopersicum TaxID=4081 RepID=A0A3Q7GJC1_SOLLC
MSASKLLTLFDVTHLTDATRYRRVLGKLQYLSFTRSDIAYVVNKLSQIMKAPSEFHWKDVKHVLRYLRGTIQLGLRVTSIEDFNLHVYSNAYWGDISDRVSTSGYILFLGTNLISWSSKKQNIVSRSSTESKYRAVDNALSETLWVTNLLTELHELSGGYPIRRPDEGNGSVRRESGVWWPFSGGRSKLEEWETHGAEIRP